VTSDDTTGQTGVSRTWKARRRLYDADRSIRTIRAHFIEARRAISLHQQAGYTAAILSLSRDHEALQNGRRPYTGFSPTTTLQENRKVAVGLKPDLRRA